MVDNKDPLDKKFTLETMKGNAVRGKYLAKLLSFSPFRKGGRGGFDGAAKTNTV